MRPPAPRPLCRRAALLLAGALVAACSAPREPLPEPKTPLAELAPLARPIVETAVVDVGEPGARGHLVRGWGPDESGSEGTFAWSGGEVASVRFDVVDPRDLTLGLRGWSYPLPGVDVQRVALALNGVALETLELGTAPASFRIPVEAARLKPGENRLELTPAHRLDRPGELAWASGWDLFRFDAGPAPEPPRIEAQGDLLLPARTALAWTLELPADSWLAWDGVEGAGKTWLEIGVRAEGEGEGERVRSASAPGRLRLTAGAGALVEVALRSRGGPGSLRVAGARLHRPPAAAAAAARPTAAAVASPRPNLIVYLIDTLRADHLGCYGYPLATSPRIDAFAREAVRWSEARAQSSWTKPAVATLLTGLYPVGHGADRRARGLAPEVETLAARLASAGYQSAMFTTNPTVTPRFGFDRGFDEFHYLSHPRGRGKGRGHVDSAEIHRAVVAWLHRRDPERPFFLVVHTLDPHDPYNPPEPFKSRFAPAVDAKVACCIRAKELAQLTPAAARERARQMIALYDGEIAQNDASFGALYDELDRRDLLDSSALLVTADHGEEFYDHGGWRHAETLYEEVVRIPMLLRLPRGAHAGVVLDAPADQIDVAPTLLDLAGLEPPAGLPGESWLPALTGATPPAGESFAWLEHPSFSIASLVDGPWKVLRSRGGWRPPLERGPDELYDLAADPLERENLTSRRPLRRHWLATRLAAALARQVRAAPTADVPIDPELERELRALGYF